MTGIDLLNFSFSALASCRPFFVMFLPFAIGLMFIATVPDIIRKVIGVRE